MTPDEFSEALRAWMKRYAFPKADIESITAEAHRLYTAALEAANQRGTVSECGNWRIVHGHPACLECGELYGSPRFPDLVLDNEVWRQISPNQDENGLLCPNCICARLAGAGIENVRGVFRSGPLAQDESTLAAERQASAAAVEAAQARASQFEGELACCCDILNTWARELGIRECRDPYSDLAIRDHIDRIWSVSSSKAHERLNAVYEKLEAAQEALEATSPTNEGGRE